jgi:hypothetical protein
VKLCEKAFGYRFTSSHAVEQSRCCKLCAHSRTDIRH